MLLEQLSEEPVPLPDFRNFGVILRILVVVHLGMLAYVLLGLSRWEEWPLRLGEAAMWVELPRFLGPTTGWPVTLATAGAHQLDTPRRVLIISVTIRSMVRL